MSASGFDRSDPSCWTVAQTIVVGQFVGSARWVTAPHGEISHGAPLAPTRPATNAQQDFAAAAEAVCGAQDTELGAILGGIAEEVHQIAVAVRAGIMADFAARAAHARKHLPRHLIAGALAAIRQARGAALAVARQNTKAELQGRKKAAVATRRRPRRNRAKPTDQSPPRPA
jgi:hypothetical protein